MSLIDIITGAVEISNYALPYIDVWSSGKVPLHAGKGRREEWYDICGMGVEVIEELNLLSKVVGNVVSGKGSFFKDDDDVIRQENTVHFTNSSTKGELRVSSRDMNKSCVGKEGPNVALEPPLEPSLPLRIG
jgi:hypothetical protein